MVGVGAEDVVADEVVEAALGSGCAFVLGVGVVDVATGVLVGCGVGILAVDWAAGVGSEVTGCGVVGLVVSSEVVDSGLGVGLDVGVVGAAVEVISGVVAGVEVLVVGDVAVAWADSAMGVVG